VNILRCLIAVPKLVHRVENGQVLILAAAAMVAVLGLGALSIDIGFLMHERQNVQNATDAAALAGAQLLPDYASSADSAARQYATTNDANLNSSNTSVTFRCLIGAVNGSPRLSDVPAACDPKNDASWTTKGDVSISPCIPANGDKCNVIVVTASSSVNFFLAPVLGIKTGSTGNATSAASIMGPVMPLYVKSLGVDVIGWSALAAASALGMFLLEWVWGALYDRIDRRLLMIISVLAMSILFPLYTLQGFVRYS
jgi:Flp pilus assembly protein TadG